MLMAVMFYRRVLTSAVDVVQGQRKYKVCWRKWETVFLKASNWFCVS